MGGRRAEGRAGDGRRHGGPVGACRAQMLAECQAAAVAIRTGVDRTETARTADAERMLGLYTALAWLCGHHDDRP
ncbi:hypothetical protein ACFQ0M_00120 [Kitasatospora aburaviensis]